MTATPEPTRYPSTTPPSIGRARMAALRRAWALAAERHAEHASTTPRGVRGCVGCRAWVAANVRAAMAAERGSGAAGVVLALGAVAVLVLALAPLALVLWSRIMGTLAML